jgi:hypothetical protein
MNCLQEVDISCPYCGEVISILVDGSVEAQQYIEDCQVCCRPIVIVLSVSSRGDCLVEARHENDA